MFNHQPLKVAIIREEFCELLNGNYKLAIVLNQLLYWQERTKDSAKMAEEEMNRLVDAYDLSPQKLEQNETLKHGWIYKNAEELAEETLMGCSKQTMGRYLKELENMGYITSRENPILKWDRTLQYRVDVLKVAADLIKLGYQLQGYKFSQEINQKLYKDYLIYTGEIKPEQLKKEPEEDEEPEAFHDDNINHQEVGDYVNPRHDANSKMEHRENQNGTCKFQNGTSKFQSGTAIPEITCTDYFKESKKAKNPGARENILFNKESQDQSSKESSSTEDSEYEKEENHKVLTDKGRKNNNPQQDKIVSDIIRYWDDNGFGVYYMDSKNKLLAYLDDFEEGGPIILRALEISADNGSANYSYVRAILNRWINRGFQTLAEIKIAESSHKKNRNKSQINYEEFDLDE